MAQSTATWTKLRRITNEGPGGGRAVIYDVNVTSAAADGVEVSAANFGARSIVSVEVLSGQESGGYVMQYIPDSQGGVEVGDGDLRVYEAGADAAALDEVVTGDLGQFRVKLVLR